MRIACKLLQAASAWSTLGGACVESSPRVLSLSLLLFVWRGRFDTEPPGAVPPLPLAAEAAENAGELGKMPSVEASPSASAPSASPARRARS